MKHLLPLLAVIPLLFSCRGKAAAPETRHGDPAEKIRMLKDFGGKKINVDDPWCSGDYAKAYEEIFIGCSELLKELSTK